MSALEHFDHVIVGAGSAGCVLAARLSGDASRRVLLLEAGPRDRSWRIAMPAAVGSLLSSERFNWNYTSEPEPYLDGRRLTHPRGRVLGGSSSINGMVYVRGHAADYDAWAAQGLRGWAYADVLPYFKRSENHLHGADAYHGATGPLTVFAPDLTRAPLAAAFVSAALQAGYGAALDANGARQEGFGRVDRTTTQQGSRCSAARAYLAPAAARNNLKIVPGALVHRIQLQGTRATGVAYAVRGRMHTAFAASEVIISAGAINSPHLLQLSGIGPSALSDHGVAVRHELPAVGANLNDHPDLVVQHHCLQSASLYGANRGIPKLIAGLRWFAGLGGVAASNHFEAGGFLRSRAGVEQPDIQLTFMPLAIKPGTVADVGAHSFQIHIDLLRPKSLGSVMLRSADPAVAPSIRFNYLADPQDRADLRNAVRLTREIIAQAALQPYRGKELNPGSEVQDDAQLDAWIRRSVETCYHPVGTCRMGTNAGDSVVDGDCRVHGLTNLRVVDASVMPAIVSGNTNAPTIMIAEKISDSLRERSALPREEVPVWRHPAWATAQR